MGSNRLGQHRTIQPIKKPLTQCLKAFLVSDGLLRKEFWWGGVN